MELVVLCGIEWSSTPDDRISKNYQDYLSMQLTLIMELTFLEFDLTEQLKKDNFEI